MASNPFGLTLLELCIILAVISILTGLSIPGIQPWLLHYRLKSQVRNISTDFQFIKLRAISQNTDYAISFTLNNYPTPDTYQIKYIDSNSCWQKEGPSKQILPKIDIDHISGPQDIQFSSQGSCDSDGVIYLTNYRREKYKILLSSSTGNIKIREGW